MEKAEKTVYIGAAECARRTGLTVRALRVYERHGLIEPRRTDKGWRCYGPRELQRLNVIVTLKALGMTLAQIRTLLKTKSPPLARVLQIQLRACSARKDAVEKALALVRAALATIGSGKPLSLDELCDLTRSMEMGMEMNGGNKMASIRRLINEQVTPEEERAHMNWAASLSSEEWKAVQEASKAARAVRRSLQDLYEKKLDPAAPAVQALIIQLKDVSRRYGVFKLHAAMLEWNPSITRKYFEIGARGYWVGMSDDFVAYLRAANAAAPWSKALTQVTDEATKLVEQKVEPSSELGQALAKHLALICSDHLLGDPLLYARRAPYSPFRKSVDEKGHARLTSTWAFLAAALEAAAPGALDAQLPRSTATSEFLEGKPSLTEASCEEFA
ncbi:MAG TPA: MerR family transcriptional regulator [Steroidobacteraceae bacterium]|nr:MerR family transcriptional regulator [Steroidobacteraceae bacterium]